MGNRLLLVELGVQLARVQSDHLDGDRHVVLLSKVRNPSQQIIFDTIQQTGWTIVESESGGRLVHPLLTSLTKLLVLLSPPFEVGAIDLLLPTECSQRDLLLSVNKLLRLHDDIKLVLDCVVATVFLVWIQLLQNISGRVVVPTRTSIQVFHGRVGALSDLVWSRLAFPLANLQQDELPMIQMTSLALLWYQSV